MSVLSVVSAMSGAAVPAAVMRPGGTPRIRPGPRPDRPRIPPFGPTGTGAAATARQTGGRRSGHRRPRLRGTGPATTAHRTLDPLINALPRQAARTLESQTP